VCSRCSRADYAEKNENDDAYTAVHHHSNSVATRIGTLKFFDGFPDDDTVLLPASLRLSEVHFDRA